MMQDIDNVLYSHHRSVWQQELRREEANNGPGRNKLHTYRQFKRDTVTEPYLIRVFVKNIDRHLQNLGVVLHRFI